MDTKAVQVYSFRVFRNYQSLSRRLVAVSSLARWSVELPLRNGNCSITRPVISAQNRAPVHPPRRRSCTSVAANPLPTFLVRAMVDSVKCIVERRPVGTYTLLSSALSPAARKPARNENNDLGMGGGWVGGRPLQDRGRRVGLRCARTTFARVRVNDTTALRRYINHRTEQRVDLARVIEKKKKWSDPKWSTSLLNGMRANIVVNGVRIVTPKR